MTGIKLELGKYYKTLEGRKCELVSICDDGHRIVILIRSTLHKVWKNHLIAEWTNDPESKPQGPVITETVKRIVPGVYGVVSVKAGFGANVGVALVGDMGKHPDAVVGHCWLSRADLIAARDVLNQLIDAIVVS